MYVVLLYFLVPREGRLRRVWCGLLGRAGQPGGLHTEDSVAGTGLDVRSRRMNK
jgi:hypothetical protein